MMGGLSQREMLQVFSGTVKHLSQCRLGKRIDLGQQSESDSIA
jgi:hypothetical protein